MLRKRLLKNITIGAIIFSTIANTTACNKKVDVAKETVNESVAAESETNSAESEFNIDDYYTEELLNPEVTADQKANYVSTFTLNNGKFRISDFTYNMDTIMGEELSREHVGEGKISYSYIWHDIKRFNSKVEQESYYKDFLSNYKEATDYLDIYKFVEQADSIMVIYNDVNTGIMHKFTMPSELYHAEPETFDNIYSHIAFTKEKAEDLLSQSLAEYEELDAKYQVEYEEYKPIAEAKKKVLEDNNITSQEDLDKYLGSLSDEELRKQDELFNQPEPEKPVKPDGIVGFDGGYFVYSDNYKIYRNNIDSAYYTGYGSEEGIDFSYETRRLYLPDGYDYTNHDVLSYIVDGINENKDKNYDIIELGTNLYQRIVTSNLPENSVTTNEKGEEELIKSNADNQITYRHYDKAGFITDINLKDKSKKEEFENLLSNYASFNYAFAEEINLSDLKEEKVGDVTIKIPTDWTLRGEDKGVSSYYSPDGSESITFLSHNFTNSVNIPAIAYNLLTYQTPGYNTKINKTEIDGKEFFKIGNYYTDKAFKMYFTLDKDKLYLLVYWASPFKYNTSEIDYISDKLANSIKFDTEFDCKFDYNEEDLTINTTSYEIKADALSKIGSIIGSPVIKADSYGLQVYATSSNDLYLYELCEADINSTVSQEAKLEIIKYLSEIFSNERYGSDKTDSGRPYLERGGLFIFSSKDRKGTYYMGVEDTDKYTLETLTKIIDVLE